MHHRITNTLTAGTALLAVTLGGAGQAVHAAQTEFNHVNRVFLDELFNEDSAYGDNPLSIAFDGQNAYLGGFNNTGSAGSTGVVKVSDLFGSFGSATVSGLADTQFTAPAFRGIDALAHESTTDSLIVYHDGGSAAASFISRHNASDGTGVWSVSGPAGQRPFAGDIDPTGDGGNPAVGFLAYSQGRHLALRLSDGSVLYDASGGSNPGGIILGRANGTDDFGTAWRGVDFDSEGNIATSEQGYFGYGRRVDDNQWQTLSGTAGRVSKSVTKDVELNRAGQGIAILEGLGPNGEDLLAFTGRDMTQLTALDGSTTSVSDTNVHIRNLDGSTTGLSQLTLTGSESGLAAAWANNTKNLVYGQDAAGNHTLLVVDFVERRLDVYSTVPEPATLGLLGLGGLALLGRRRRA